MFGYTCKRVFIGILSLFVLVTAAFFLTRMMPGSPFQTGNVSESVLTSMEEEYGLNEPVFKQYATYLSNLMHGDLGISFKKPGVRVSEVITRAWPATAALGALAIVLAAVVGTLLGIWQASTKKRLVKGGIFFSTMLGTGIPNFVIALLLMLFFGVKLKLLPIAGLTGAENYILPVVSLAVYPAAVITRLMRNTFQEEMNRDYVVLAKAKGLSWRRTAVTHILKNAWIPVLNYIGPAAAFLMTGSFVVESVFTIPGLGREFVNSIENRDYTLILGLTIFMGVTVIGINLLTDLLCAWLDPRVRRAYR
ncbi:ABC transporter permease [Faecalicatena sp. AGMB00832]|uniref:ABC transporter permease n=1 Tax=Faecalicatena faecalis TaxID=2726362 RepID=A0ABS6D359_9FIRM|nr:ABC transporter permease [Faecalicatena sp.]MBU3876024.1 ABC transporter permease [Faecalicatena faecalis]MCI6468255.1 ABC transporter permease [Faecalicatena sp.]MDY5620509.1 ABC transporter permease [Lachnospiraceae bacterium]